MALRRCPPTEFCPTNGRPALRTPRAANGPRHAGRMSQPDPDARLRAADRTIALIGAMDYMRSEFPAAEMVWGP